MRHLSPLELRVLRAVDEHPRHAVEPLAQLVGESPTVVRSTVAVLRRFGLVERDRIGLIGYATYETTSAGRWELREWDRLDVCAQLPPGVIPIRRARLARHHRGSVRHV